MVASFSQELSQDAAKERDEKAAARALAEKKKLEAAKRRMEAAAAEKGSTSGGTTKKTKKVANVETRSQDVMLHAMEAMRAVASGDDHEALVSLGFVEPLVLMLQVRVGGRDP